MPRSPSTHVDDPRAVGRRLREAREAAGVSQRKLSFPGCTSAYISRIEAGQRIPSLQLIHEFARRLRVSPEWLATGAEADVSAAELLDAEVALRLGELDEARGVYERRLADDADDPTALAGLGEIALREERLEDAIALLERAVAAHPSSLSDPSTIESLARAYAAAGALEAVIALLRRALDEADAADAIVESLRFRVLLANALIDNGQPQAAEDMLAGAIAAAEAIHDPLAAARVYWSQSRLHVHHKDPRLAARYARKAIQILERTENSGYVALAYHLLAFAEIENGDPERALLELAHGRELLADDLSPVEDAKFAIEETRALLAVSRLGDAARRARYALARLDALEPQDRGRAYVLAGDVFRANGDAERAIELYQDAVETLEEHPGPFRVEAGSRLSDLLEEQGRTEEALAVLRSAVARPREREHEPRASRR